MDDGASLRNTAPVSLRWVDEQPPFRDMIFIRRSMPPKDSSSCCFNDGAEGLLHIRCHFQLVLAPLPVEAQHRNAPSVNHVRVDVAEALLIGNHLAASAESDDRAIGTAAFLLQRDAIALMLCAHSVKAPHSRHMASASELNVITAQEIVLLPKPPPGHV